jgi:hypothetical protein
MVIAVISVIANFLVIPAEPGIQGPVPRRLPWTPAFVGVTV